MSRRIGEGVSKVRCLAAAFAVSACGCAAFSIPPLASFRAPAEQFAKALADKADKPAFREKIPAAALFDVRIAGNRAVLDYRTEGTGLGKFDALPACGPLELRDVAENKRIWAAERSGDCDDVILTFVPRLVTRGVTAKGEREITARALDSGQVVAKMALTKGALALAIGDGVLVVKGEAGKQEISMLAAEDLNAKWSKSVGDEGLATHALGVGSSVLVIGSKVSAFDRATGEKQGTSALPNDAAVVDVRAIGDAAYVLLRRGKDSLSLARIGADAKIAWTVETGMVDAVASGLAITVRGMEVKALKPDGAIAWTAKLPLPATGSGLVVTRGTGALWLVPHWMGVLALDVATGAVRFDVSPFGEEESTGIARRSDRLFAAGPDRVVLDSARGVAGLDLANEGRARYVLAERSDPRVTRGARLAAAYGAYDLDALQASSRSVSEATSSQIAAMSSLSSMVGTMGSSGSMSFGDPVGAANNQMLAGSVQMSIAAAQASLAATEAAAAAGAANFSMIMASLNARRKEQATVALRQSRLDEESDYLLRPLSWATGRGILVIRKSDGAFREIVTGPPDAYEDDFRPSSLSAFIPLPKRIITFSEGLDHTLWTDAEERAPVHLVQRALVGYALDESTLQPASEYDQKSIVPATRSPSAAPTQRAPEAPAQTARPGTTTPPEPTSTATKPPPAATATATPKAPPAVTATATPKAPATSAPASPPAATCKSRFDCKGGLVCRASQCTAPACVADKDCGTGKFCSLEGACEPVSR